jgi:hypothetical protein
MIRQIQDLIQFYAQKYHAPITIAADKWEVETWKRNDLLIGIPCAKEDGVAMAKHLGGDLIVVDDAPWARVGKSWILLSGPVKSPSELAVVRRLIDQHLPRLCRIYRHEQRDLLVSSLTGCVQERKRELQSSIREDAYEIERESLALMQLSRKLETDRQILHMFEKPEGWIRSRANRQFCDLMKLVPSVYQSFRIEDDSIIGTTHPINIQYDGYTYHFDQYEVELNMKEGKVFINGGTNVNGYVHPHVTDDKGNVCYGNISHLVQRLAGELDLFSLFQLLHQFLTSYNSSDPYQRIEKWDPDWVDEEEDESPYCSYCDDYGHTISECDSCWWCEHCNEYVDHDEEDCPNRPKEESQTEETTHAMAEA